MFQLDEIHCPPYPPYLAHLEKLWGHVSEHIPHTFHPKNVKRPKCVDPVEQQPIFSTKSVFRSV